MATTTQTPTRTTENPNGRSPNPWLLIAAVAIPVFVGSLDLTIVSAFLPEIIVNLELPVESIIDDAAWVVTGYLLAYTISMTFMGRLSDLIGRRTAYVLCLAVFAFGSFIVADVDPAGREGLTGVLYNAVWRIGGVRPDPASIALITIIIGRIVQALGAGAIVPVSLALVGDLFPPEKRAQPLGLVGALDTLGWVLGHLYGGVMVRLFSVYGDSFVNLFQSLGLNWDAPDWRALFWINLPLALISLILVFVALRGAPQRRSAGRFDLAGTLLISGALTALVLGLGANIEVATSATQFSDIGGLPPYAAPVLLAAAVMFILFVIVELRARDPVIDLRSFTRRGFRIGLSTNVIVGMCLMIGLVSVPILVNIRLESAAQLSEAALQVGVLLSAFTVPMALAAIPGGWISARIGAKPTTILGMGLAALGYVLIFLTWELDTADAVIAAQMAIVGVGIGLTFSPVTESVLNDADPDKLGAASALVIIMRLLGMTVGVAALTAFASSRLATLAGGELGAEVVDPFAALEVYSRLTVQVLTEIALIGAGLCVIAVVIVALTKGIGRRETGDQPIAR